MYASTCIIFLHLHRVHMITSNTCICKHYMYLCTLTVIQYMSLIGECTYLCGIEVWVIGILVDLCWHESQNGIFERRFQVSIRTVGLRTSIGKWSIIPLALS